MPGREVHGVGKLPERPLPDVSRVPEAVRGDAAATGDVRVLQPALSQLPVLQDMAESANQSRPCCGQPRPRKPLFPGRKAAEGRGHHSAGLLTQSISSSIKDKLPGQDYDFSINVREFPSPAYKTVFSNNL